MYSTHDRASYSRIDKDGLLGISEIANAMQDCCLFHSEDVGHSALALLKKDRAWLVSSWDIVFVRRPQLGEYFTVHTWPYKFRGVFGCRNFLMETPDHETLAYADSHWFFFSPSSNLPVAVDAEEKAVYPTEPAYEMNYRSRKIFCPAETSLVQKVDVCENYLDTNRHMNNGQYIRLAVNVLPPDYEVKELRAEFRLAARMGDTLYIRTAETEEHYYVIFTDAEENPYFLSEYTTIRK